MAGKPAGLDAFSQFALALALFELGDQAGAQQMMARLIAAAQIQNGTAYWSGAGQDGYYDRKTMASDARTTALGLSALLKTHPGHELEGAIARWLMKQRSHTGWGTTNETTYAILGLTDHLLAGMASDADTTYQVSINGTAIFASTMDQVNSAVSFDIPTQYLQAGDNQLAITQSSDHALYYVVSSHTLLQESEMEATGNIWIPKPISQCPKFGSET